jgi:hypothetical protein
MAMSNRIRFHLDENVNNSVAKGLRRRGISITTTSEENLIGAADEKQLAFASSQNRVLFTHDDDFLRMHQANVAHTGIVYCHKDTRSIGEIIEALSLVWEWLTPEDMIAQVEFI